MIGFGDQKSVRAAIDALYMKQENTMGQFLDYMVQNIATEFSANIGLGTIMCAIQDCREQDYEIEDDVYEIFAEVDFCDDGHNEYQDYVFKDGTYVPEGYRIGLEHDHGLPGDGLRLDAGIFVADMGRMDTENEAEAEEEYEEEQEEG